MVDLLVKIISEIMGLLGGDVAVSEADLTTYITALQGYIIVILIALIALVAVLVAARKAKKGFRHIIRWQAVLAFTLLITICVNAICYGPMYNNVSIILNGGMQITYVSDETRKASQEVISEVGEEGIVLVKNNGILPLKSDVDSLNVFGWASSNPVFGGTGSGSTVDNSKIGIIQSLNDAEYDTNKSLTDMYIAYEDMRPVVGMREQNFTLPEPAMDSYTTEIMNEARNFSDTAVIVLGRSGGEGSDLAKDMSAVIDGSANKAEEVSVVPEKYMYTNTAYSPNGNYDEFEKGEHYLELSKTEEQLVEKVCTNFDKVVVIVNANNPMELGWVNDYEQIGAVILAPGGGSTGFSALGKILSGEVNPSGKTVDIYPADFTKSPNFHNIGAFNYNNVSDISEQIAAVDSGFEGAMSFVNYVEGIYVGYRYYETADEEGVINYDDEVIYPFGYGLSYTTFDKAISNYKDNGNTVSLDVTVKNTGSVAGKEVVELYYTPPYYNGGIEVSSVNLIEFGKTALLEPGSSETLSFEIDKEDMAAYDSDEIKVNGGGYILEAGTYTISLRDNSHEALDEVSFIVDKDIDYSLEGRESDDAVAVNRMEDARGSFEQLSRADHFANFDSATAIPADETYKMSEEVKALVKENAVGFYDGTKYNDASDEAPVLGAKNGMEVKELRGAAYDDERWDTLLDQLSFEDMVKLINVGGWQTAEIASVGMVPTSESDGPAALNNYVGMKFGTAFTSQIMLGQTWNKDLAAKVGAALAAEFKETETDGIYGPGLNIHRSAFSGRNFEYYSEDPVLSGLMVSAEVNALSGNGIMCFTKHFALNDQETNRCAFLLTYASEQAIREIYLKPYEILTKNFEGIAQAMMSSFNWIGTTPACAYGPMLNNVLRDEWGFRGMVLTDYDGSYGSMITDNVVRNGGDLKLGFYTTGGSLGGLNVNTSAMTDESPTIVLAMRQACKNIMFSVVNSNAYAGDVDLNAMSNMDKLFITVDVIIGAVIILTELILFLNYRKKHMEKQKLYLEE